MNQYLLVHFKPARTDRVVFLGVHGKHFNLFLFVRRTSRFQSEQIVLFISAFFTEYFVKRLDL